MSSQQTQIEAERELVARAQKYSTTLQAEKLARKLISEKDLLDLITTYPDDEAHYFLDELRGQFWASDECQNQQDEK